MALTRSFKDLVQSRVERDPAFGAALLREGVDVMLSGNGDGGKATRTQYAGVTEVCTVQCKKCPVAAQDLRFTMNVPGSPRLPCYPARSMA